MRNKHVNKLKMELCRDFSGEECKWIEKTLLKSLNMLGRQGNALSNSLEIALGYIQNVMVSVYSPQGVQSTSIAGQDRHMKRKTYHFCSQY